MFFGLFRMYRLVSQQQERNETENISIETDDSLLKGKKTEERNKLSYFLILSSPSRI